MKHGFTMIDGNLLYYLCPKCLSEHQYQHPHINDVYIVTIHGDSIYITYEYSDVSMITVKL